MILKALNLISVQLNEYIEPLAGDAEVILGNIGMHELPDQNQLKDKVVITLVNTEEESTLKNFPHNQKNGNLISYIHNPVHLNLYLLFCGELSPVVRYSLNKAFRHYQVFSAQEIV
jgi:hypothetical protein